jgi:filamentous hemagglutinin
MATKVKVRLAKPHGYWGWGGCLRQVAAACAVGANSASSFASEAKLASHFSKHGAEFKVKTVDEYLQVGRDVMQQGQRVEYAYMGETRTGYVQFMGNTRSGEAKFAFVGTNTEGAITTIHVERARDLFKLLNGNKADTTIRMK